MRLNMLPELWLGPGDLIGLVEVTLLVAVFVVAYWLLRAAQRAERTWWQQCACPRPSQRALVRHRMSTEDAVRRSMPQEQPAAPPKASLAAPVQDRPSY